MIVYEGEMQVLGGNAGDVEEGRVRLVVSGGVG